ncbi:unnamed protein product, partial [Owenia fusiformis]
VSKDSMSLSKGTASQEKQDSQKLPPMFTLSSEWNEIGREVSVTTERILQEGNYVLGPEVGELESVLAGYVGVEHCIAVGSGTDALQIAMMALDVTRGDEVIVPSFTCMATVEGLCILGATPVFVDVTADTFNINVNLIKDAITSKTKAIIAVSVYGLIADLDGIEGLLKSSNRQDVTLIEDASHSFGAKKNGKRSCNFSKIACTSFYPMKPLGCYGDGGAIFTSDTNLATKMRIISRHGMVGRYEHVMLGMNSKLDTIQAGILLTKMKSNHYEKSLQSRKDVAAIYEKYLSDQTVLTLPSPPSYNDHIYAVYTVIVNKISRDTLRDELERAGLETRIQWPKPLHLQDMFNYLPCVKKPCPISEELCKNILSLPIFPFMTESEAKSVAITVGHAISALMPDC